MKEPRRPRMAWAFDMPAKDTFQVKAIRQFVVAHLYEFQKRYSRGVRIVDPFARNSSLANITNDLNPATCAKFHLDVMEFLVMLARKREKFHVVIWDPPYSLAQIKRSYESVGLKLVGAETRRMPRWPRERDLVSKILSDDGLVLSFGWSSSGMGFKRGFETTDILLVNHKGGHHDTICIAERRREFIGRVPLLLQGVSDVRGTKPDTSQRWR